MVACGFVDADGVPGHFRLVLAGPTLTVNIGFDPDYNSGSGTPNLAAVGVPALIDTGATISFIDDDLAKALDLPIVDKKTFGGIGGAHEANMYLAQIHIPDLTHTLYGEFGGVKLAAGGQQHRALLGRMFLRRFDLRYNGGTGEVEIIKV
ncbi:MAG: retroviral-like aspartic protease family protein [Devosia nanyangense]|uniref:Retroviral-like aspartic protease family protein n=1 Tax=Devosia nanyangense TaxID=1228055 RepID=A0A933NZL7_9HYPH|nr:retroviral-like aspartic protease family protein [Devosia nanyangense]